MLEKGNGTQQTVLKMDHRVVGGVIPPILHPYLYLRGQNYNIHLDSRVGADRDERDDDVGAVM